MEPAPSNPLPATAWWTTPGIKLRYLFIFVVTFFGKFLFAADFGFYEDDYLQILPFYRFSLGDALQRAWFDLRTWTHGEPIGFAISELHAYLVTRFDTLLVGFLLGLILIGLNGCLFYLLAKRFFPDFPAFIAACVFVLYPADTSEQIIMNQPWQVLNLTFVLLAFLFYRRNIVLAYGLALCSLLTYEHFFFPFAAAPFLLAPGERFSWKRCFSHAFFIVISATCMILVRDFIGEARARDVTASPGLVLNRVPSAIGLGITNSIGTLFARIADAFLHGGLVSWNIVVLATIGIGLALRRSRSPETAAITEPEQSWGNLFIIAGGALFAAAAGYVLAFRPDDYPPIMNLGRLSGFNAPASIGISILVGWVVTVLSRLNAIAREVVAWISAASIGALIAAGIYIQQVDYVASWNQQRSCLQQLFDTSNTWDSDTVLLIDLDNSDRKSMSTPGFPLYWLTIDLPDAVPELMHIVAVQEFTKDHHACPTAIGYMRRLKTVAEPGGVRIEMENHAPIHIKDGYFQIFQIHHGRLLRVNDPVWSVAGVQLHQQSPEAKRQWQVPLSKAGTVLFEHYTFWPSVENGIMYPTTPPYSRAFGNLPEE